MIHKETTTSTRVEETLEAADDFMTAAMLSKKTGRSVHDVTSALIHLRNYKAAECVEQDRRLWWFLTPKTDTRSKKVHERTPETKPRKKVARKLHVKEPK